MPKLVSDYVYGVHAVCQLLKNLPDKARQLFLQKGADIDRLSELKVLAEQSGTSVQMVNKQKLSSLVGSEQHQGVCCEARLNLLKPESFIQTYLSAINHVPLILVLDQVQDPHNLGACIRTAEACRADFVIITKHGAANLSPVVHKVSCGASFTRPIVQASNLSRVLTCLKKEGIWLVATQMNAKPSLYDLDYRVATAFILGNEGEGIRHLTAQHCDHQMHIPMMGQVESLNVSVATAICLYEATRQRLQG